MKIKIKYHADIDELEFSAGNYVDLRCAEDVDMKQGEYKVISLGVSMELPTDYHAQVFLRSSTPDKWGIVCANSVGIIDSGYNGDGDVWRLPAYATRDTHIPKNTRIAQFQIVHNQPIFNFETVEELGNVDRGGLGSSGWS